MDAGAIRRTSAALCAIAVAALATASPAPAGDHPALPDCALGRLPAPIEERLPARIAREERRFAASIDATGADADRARRQFSAAVAAYLFGYPTVVLRATVDRWPPNLLIGVGSLSTPESRSVVAPNNDTLYTVANVDLSAGPVVVDAPATGGRYSVLQLMDAHSNSFAYVGSGRDRRRAESVALLPPGWQGDLPAGVRGLHSPSSVVWLLGRTLVDGPGDLGAATALMRRYALTPLASWALGERKHAAIVPSSAGQAEVTVPTGAAFFDTLADALAADPPLARDRCALAAFARAGIAAGSTPSASTAPIRAAALPAAAAAGPRLIRGAFEAIRRQSRRKHEGWAVTRPDAGRFGRDYAYRAVVARFGLAANVRREAYYPQTEVDSRGGPLTGRRDYVVTFRRGELPPVRGFWSMTMYDEDRFLVENPIDRYAVGDRTGGLRYGPGGSLRIHVSHDPPERGGAANWLPAPPGRFELHLRLYEPKPKAFEDDWRMPTVNRLDPRGEG